MGVFFMVWHINIIEGENMKVSKNYVLISIIFVIYILSAFNVSVNQIINSGTSNNVSIQGKLLAAAIATIISFLITVIFGYFYKTLMVLVAKFMKHQNYNVKYKDIWISYSVVQIVNSIFNIISFSMFNSSYINVSKWIAVLLGLILTVIFFVLLNKNKNITVNNSVITVVVLFNLFLTMVPIFK